jgi:hypothetical protein
MTLGGHFEARGDTPLDVDLVEEAFDVVTHFVVRLVWAIQEISQRSCGCCCALLISSFVFLTIFGNYDYLVGSVLSCYNSLFIKFID